MNASEHIRKASDGTLLGVYIFNLGGRFGLPYKINNQTVAFTAKEKALAYRARHKQELQGSFLRCVNLCQDEVCAGCND